MTLAFHILKGEADLSNRDARVSPLGQPQTPAAAHSVCCRSSHVSIPHE
jgi:hypothetical protein